LLSKPGLFLINLTNYERGKGGFKMEKISFVTGIGLIALSGILFTIERFITVFQNASESFPVKLNGNGSFSSQPMPGIFDNFFVGLFLVLGIVLLVFAAIKVFKTQGDR
jgi:hypothetical protein